MAKAFCHLFIGNPHNYELITLTGIAIMAVFNFPLNNSEPLVNLASELISPNHSADINTLTHTRHVVFSEDLKTNFEIVLRKPNPSYPIDPRLSGLLRDLFEEHRQGLLHSSVDCSELSELLANELQSNDKCIMFISAATKGKSILVPEWRADPNALALSRYCYHSVLKVNGYILDPRLSGEPIAKGDYFQLVKGINAQGHIRHQILSPHIQSNEISSILAASQLY